MDSNGELQTISNHEIQQIAGRAGRSSEDGYVQTLNLSDFKKVRKALRDVNKSYGINLEQNMDTLLEIQKRNEDIKEQSYEQYANESINLKRKFLKEQTELKSAGLSISFDQLQRFKYQIQALQNKKYSLDQIFNQFIQICQMDQTFFIQKVKTSSILLKQIQNFNLELKDQYTFSMVPINSTNNKILLNQYSNLARMYKYQKQVKLPEIIKKIHQHQIKYKQEFSRLKFLQYNYSILQMYIWLSGKYQLAFRHKEQAQKLKNYICAKINNILLIESDETKQKDFNSQKRTKRD